MVRVKFMEQNLQYPAGRSLLFPLLHAEKGNCDFELKDVSYPRASQPRWHGQRRTVKYGGNEAAYNKRNESGLLAGHSVLRLRYNAHRSPPFIANRDS